MSYLGAIPGLLMVLACSREVSPPPPAAPPHPASASGAVKRGQEVGQTPASAPAAPTHSISGTVSLAPALVAKVGKGSCIYLMARSPQGALLAVKKVEHPSFPLKYTLGANEVMLHGAHLAGKVNVSARVDQDGDAMTKVKGDLVGAFANNPVDLSSGDRVGVDLKIATELP